MDYSYFVQGYILGISVASTIGISGVLCLQNIMTGQVSIALASAAAASLADMSCAMLVVFGLKAGQDFLLAYKNIFEYLTGAFLCFLGASKLLSKVVLQSGHRESRSVIVAFCSVFFLALVDPVSILDFMALCMGLTLDFSVILNAVHFTLGLLIGSATWWFGICGLLLFFHARVPVIVFEIIQKIVGCGIILFGLITLRSAWQVV
jgi:arginine exporter protein ArgO